MPLTTDVRLLADKIAAAVVQLDRAGQELGVNLIHLLGQGAPVSPAKQAERVGWTEERVVRQLERWPGVYRADVSDLRPAEAVVSLLVPDRPLEDDVIASFCRFVHFFASPEAAATWTSEHEGMFVISVEDAFEVGRLVNRVRFGEALGRLSVPPRACQGSAGRRLKRRRRWLKHRVDGRLRTRPEVLGQENAPSPIAARMGVAAPGTLTPHRHGLPRG